MAMEDTRSVAGSPETGGFHYIIVGSGAGGAPLAARLVLRGYRVLVLEAGADHSSQPPEDRAREISQVPSFHGASTEDPDLSWQFFVKHYDDAARQPWGADTKEYYGKDKNGQPDPTRTGIFYPRAAGLGGCTIHNAMITIAGPDNDWDDLADFLDDGSWKSQEMRAYFERLECNQYLPPPEQIPKRYLRTFWHHVRWLVDFPYGRWLRAPDYTAGRHGFDGWLHTSVTKLSLGLSDSQLIKMLTGALAQSKREGLNRAGTWLSTIFKGEIQASLDPNHARTQAEHPSGVFMVPLAVYGEQTPIQPDGKTPLVQRGRRSSPREFLLEARARFPDRLEIRTNCFVTRVLFDEDTSADNAREPRAVGVEYLAGENLYQAHPEPNPAPPTTPERVFVRAGGEVILSGGSFNTPQTLMLSGLGDVKHLESVAGGSDACTLRDRQGQPLRSVSRIDLPAVGTNLQDRYEVTVISDIRKNFSLLDRALFRPPHANEEPDIHLKEWREAGTGLYTSNGAVLGIFKSSRPELLKPDLFIFGVPLPFEGYKVGYSKVGDIHDQFTWAILKGNTSNHDGTVRLRDTNPLSTPDINFHYFNEVTRPGASGDDPDLAALVDGVKFVRGIADHARLVVRDEHYPGRAAVPGNDDEQLKNFIRRAAWGHHATGTCRMGPPDDNNAVLDSRFRVRRVAGLRVVDASVFPKIPGYFIVTNVYMVSEKAADVILEDAPWLPDGTLKAVRPSIPDYPAGLWQQEAEAIALRRSKIPFDIPDANQKKSGEPDSPPEEQKDRVLESSEAVAPVPVKPDAEADLDSARDESTGRWRADVTGLALSGGGIRSATFNLGVLQALAGGHKLRRVDFLSTVSGGGYIGAFLGRAYDRYRQAALAPDKRPAAALRVESELTKPGSLQIDWLRKYANYVAPATGDLRLDLAVVGRNLISVHFVIGLLCIAVFGLINGCRYLVLDPASAGFSLLAFSQSDWPLSHLVAALLGPFYSPWFLVVEALFLLVVLPRAMGYWLVSRDQPGRYNPPALVLNLVLAGVLLFLGIRDGLALEPLALGLSLLCSFLAVERAWKQGRQREEAVGIGSISTQRLRVRNELTYDLGLGLAMAGFALGFALIDTAGFALQQSLVNHNKSYTTAFAGIVAVFTALIPVVRSLTAVIVRPAKGGPPSTLARLLRSQLVSGGLATVLLIAPLLVYSFTVHAVYQGGQAIPAGLLVTGLALVLSLILAQKKAIIFANDSSLSQTYGSRLARTFLGATNPQRQHPSGQDITEVMAGDDVPSLTEYRPHETGGPLHLLNLTVNQTVDFSSLRGNRYRKGNTLSVSCLGLSIGQHFHALWKRPVVGTAALPDSVAPDTVGVTLVGHSQGADHPLVDAAGHPASRVEMLPLREWMAISGAAVGPGRGYSSSLGAALLCGLTNLRTGYWWNSGLSEAGRSGFPDLSRLRRLLYLLPRLFRTQSLLISEWTARFAGPWQRYWNLSDGGFSEVTGAYELIRRRVPRIIVADATEDPEYQFEGLANLIRLVRIDFGANIEWIPKDRLGHRPPAGNAAATAPPKGFLTRRASGQSLAEETQVDQYLNLPPVALDYLGSLDELKSTYDQNGHVLRPSQKHGALFWVVYPDQTRSLLLFLKSSVSGDESRDVIQYQDAHPEFPQESTADQFFNEPQWESYRALGEHVATPFFTRQNDWFWNVPL